MSEAKIMGFRRDAAILTGVCELCGHNRAEVRRLCRPCHKADDLRASLGRGELPAPEVVEGVRIEVVR